MTNHLRTTRRPVRRARPALASALLAVVALAPAALAADDSGQSREVAGIAEEQALLRRQLQRLRQTMEVLVLRLEAEGRPRAVDLLKEGMTLLDMRAESTRGLTLEETMAEAEDRLDEGQLARSVQSQESVLEGLERLLAVLMDRRNLEGLEESIQELRELQARMGELAEAEREVIEETGELRESIANDEQRELESGIEGALERQRELLAENEALGRESGTIELEQLARLLAELRAAQEADAGVLRAWRPAEEAMLEAAREPVEEARRLESVASTVGEHADELERAADAARRGSDEAAPALQRLEEAAERARIYADASDDEAIAAAARALREAVEALRAAGADERALAEAAGALEESARALDERADEQRARAEEARREALRALEDLPSPETAAGAIGADVREALERASRSANPAEADSPLGPEGALRETLRSTEDAARLLEEGQRDLNRLGPTLAESQSASAEEADRMGRALQHLGPERSSAKDAVREALAGASGAMREASAAARGARAEASAAAATRAEAELERAARELEALRSETADELAERVERMAEAQGELAGETEALESALAEAPLSPGAREAVESALEQASGSMRGAGEQLSQGNSGSAAGAQREAVEALQRARQGARTGVTPQTAEQRERAEALAQRQEELRREILDLALRVRERENERPAKSLDRAEQQAQQAGRSLSRGSLDEAEEAEREVERELEQAQVELAREEETYQRLRQEELLFRITEEVTQLAEAHEAERKAVAEIDAQRTSEDQPTRALRIRLRNVSRAEGALADRAGELAEAIGEEGSVVFAELLSQIQRDLERIERDLSEEGGWRSDDRVRSVQDDVAESLGWLLESLRQEQRRREQEAQQDQQQQEQQQEDRAENRLVPDAAELKLLRRMEVEVQDAIERLLAVYPELSEEDVPVDSLILEDVLRLAGRHERVTELFGLFRERLGLPDPDEDATIEEEEGR